MRRALVLGVLTGAWMAAGSLTSVASGSELEDFLHAADEAAYSGRQIVVSYWDSEVLAGLYDVARAGGVVAVADGGINYTMGEGKVDRKAGSRQEQMVL